jgi:hypothetical protein
MLKTKESTTTATFSEYGITNKSSKRKLGCQDSYEANMYSYKQTYTFMCTGNLLLFQVKVTRKS